MLATRERGRTIVSGYLRRAAAAHASDAVVIDTEHYSARMGSWHLGTIPMSAIEDPNRATVTRYPVPDLETGPGRHLVGLLVSGRGQLVTEERTTVLRPGGIVLYDSLRPFVLHFDEPYRYIVSEIPDAMLLARPGQEYELSGLRDELGATPAAGMAVDMLSSLPARADRLSVPALERLGDTLVALLRDAIGDVQGTTCPQHPVDDALPRIRTWIDTHLADPDLSPARIAAAHFISVRYLHRIFQRHGLTVGDYVRTRRIERVKAALLDPRNADLPVSAIAARWGFTDATHFIRRFRMLEGESPARWRRDRLQRTGD